MGEADRIEVVYREDARARLAAMAWFEKHAVARWEYRLAQAIAVLTIILFGAVVAMTLAMGLGMETRYVFAVTTLVAILTCYGWCAWRTSYRRRVSGAFDTEAWGEARYVFCPEGVALSDDQRTWTTGWRGVAAISAEREGVFFACKGIVFYLPVACWPDAASMAEDTRRAETWWRAAGSPL